MTDAQDRAKALAAARALDFVRDGMTVGLGTGSTAEHFVRLLAERVRSGLTVRAVPTSVKIAALAGSLGVPVIRLDEVARIDVTVDGADEIDLATFGVLKGRGGALLREKLVARASCREVIAVDWTKPVRALGELHAVSVEVAPFGWRQSGDALLALGASAVTLRRGAAGDAPFVTDNANLILDADFGALADPTSTERAIKQITGVVESGLFVGLCHTAVVADADGARVYERTPAVDAPAC